MSMSVIAAAALLVQAAPPPAAPPAQAPARQTPYAPRISADDATEVEAVEVRAARPDRLLSVAVGGDVQRRSVVGSAPIGLNCGGDYFRFERDDLRQCWLRQPRGQQVLLTASDDGVFGRDWRVEWVGCTPRASGVVCEVDLSDDRQVAVSFRRITNRN